MIARCGVQEAPGSGRVGELHHLVSTTCLNLKYLFNQIATDWPERSISDSKTFCPKKYN